MRKSIGVVHADVWRKEFAMRIARPFQVLSRMTMVLMPLAGGGGCVASAAESTEEVDTAHEELMSACVASPSAASCDYQDPVVAGCDQDAITLASKQVSGWPYYDWVEQRYSAKCKSRYTRYTAAHGIVSKVFLTRVSPSTSIVFTHNGTLNYTDLLYCPRNTCAAWSAVLIDSTKTTIGPVY